MRRIADDAPRVLLVTQLRTPPGDGAAQALRAGLSTELARVIVGNDARLIVADPSDASASTPRKPDFLITGEAEMSGGTLRADLRLLDRRSLAILWSESFSRAETEVDAMRVQIAAKVADVSVCALGGRNPPLRQIGVETMRLYLAACEEKHGDWNQSAKLLLQVVQRDPTFAHAWAMLSAATAVSGKFEPRDAAISTRTRAEAYAKRALSLDPTDGEAYAGRAWAFADFAQWRKRVDIEVAGRRVEPDNAQLLSGLGDDMALVGRVQEATAFQARALQLDPFSPLKGAALARDLGFSGDTGALAALLARGTEMWPNYAPLSAARFTIAAREGDPAEAVALLDTPGRPFPMPASEAMLWRKVLTARIRHTPAASVAAIRAVRADAPLQDAEGKMQDAAHLVALGQIDDAYAVADQIGLIPTSPKAWTLFADFMAPFRADPRFMALAKRQGLTAIWRETGRWPDFCERPGLPYDCRAEAAKLGG